MTALSDLIATTICQSGKFETGEGTCAAICMDQLGDARSRPCHHAGRVHAKLTQAIVAALKAREAAR